MEQSKDTSVLLKVVNNPPASEKISDGNSELRRRTIKQAEKSEYVCKGEEVRLELHGKGLKEKLSQLSLTENEMLLVRLQRRLPAEKSGQRAEGQRHRQPKASSVQ